MPVACTGSLTAEQLACLERLLSARSEELQKSFAEQPETVDQVAEREREERELAYVVSALGRLQLAEFGRCIDCNSAIPYARLRANPIATRCLACQQAHERSAADGAS